MCRAVAGIPTRERAFTRKQRHPLYVRHAVAGILLTYCLPPHPQPQTPSQSASNRSYVPSSFPLSRGKSGGGYSGGGGYSNGSSGSFVGSMGGGSHRTQSNASNGTGQSQAHIPEPLRAKPENDPFDKAAKPLSYPMVPYG